MYTSAFTNAVDIIYLQIDIVYFAIHEFFYNIKVSLISANGGYILFQHNSPFH